jgi:tyrosyl-DNA phosphodiesterase-1
MQISQKPFLLSVCPKYWEPYAFESSADRRSDRFFQTDELQMAILSSFSTDISWIYSMFPPKIPVILIQQPDESGNAKVKNILPNWVLTTPFLRGGRGAMHIKVSCLHSA